MRWKPLLLAGVLTPSTAFAFPVVVGSITQSLLFMVLFGAGATAYAAKKSRKALIATLAASLLFCAYIISTSVATDALSLKAQHFPSEALSQKSQDNMDRSNQLMKTISIFKAERLIRNDGYVPIQVADKPVPFIDGLNTFTSKNSKEAEEYLLRTGAKGAILFSNYLTPAVNLANELTAFQENIFIVSTSKGMTYSASNGIDYSKSYLDEFLTGSVFGVKAALEKIEYHVQCKIKGNTGGENDTLCNAKPSKVDLFLHNETKQSMLSAYNVLVLGGDDILNSYLSMGSKALPIPVMLTMKDEEWKSLAESMDGSKPLLVSFTDNHSESIQERLAEYVKAKLLSQKVIGGKAEYSNGVYWVQKGADSSKDELHEYYFPLSVEYTLASDFYSISPPLPTDNYITPFHHNSDRHMSATTLYAEQRNHEEIRLLCFTKNCIDRLPPSSSSFNTTYIDPSKQFSFKDYSLVVDKIGFQKDKPVVIVTEDASTSLLGYYLAHDLVSKGYNFLGFTNLYNGIFGGTYLNPLAKGEDEEFYYDDIRVRVDTTIQEIALFFTPSSPYQVSSVWLILIGAVLGLGISIRAFPLYVKVTSLSVTVYFSIYGSMWVQSPISEYQSLFVPNWAYIALTGVLTAIRLKHIYDNGIRRLSCAAEIAVMALLITLAFSPVMDRFYFGVLAASVVVSLLRLWLCNNDAVSVVGDKFLFTRPFVSGFEGYLVNAGGHLNLLQLLPSKKWIVRSNHLTPLESGAGGFYDSFVVSRGEVNSVIFEETMRLCEEDKLGKEAARKTQFWVMPYKEFHQRGCAESHLGGHSLKAHYAIGDKFKVTEGLGGNEVMLDREADLVRTDKFVLQALERCEKELGCPVVIEFGISKMLTIDILQVRPQKLTPRADHEMLKMWRERGRGGRLIDFLNLDPMTQSIMFRMYNRNVVVADDGTYYVGSNPTRAFDLNVIRGVVDKLKVVAEDLSFIKSANTELVIERVAEIVKPLTEMDTTGDVSIYGASVNELINECISIAAKAHGGMPEKFCLSADRFKSYGGIGLKYVSKRDAVRFAMLLGFSSISKSVKLKGVSNKVSLDGWKAGYSDWPKGYVPKRGEQRLVVVEGELPKSEVSKFYLKTISDVDLKSVTLRCGHLEAHLMHYVPKLGGIIATEGTTLSHLAMTAKHFGIPMIIER